ncbi:MAG: PEP-CTERM-box response regulator transcription factor [Hydrogenophilaceae bacterium]|nr:PEP-CTERM-box response regulator transcription factor [Hydrogenophilaceae bacterium]
MSEKKPSILVIEDDPGLQKQIKWSLDQYEVLTAATREEAISQLRRQEPAVVLLDLGLPPDPDGATEGLAALEQILSLAPNTKVIVITGNQDRSNAVKAIGMGAFDFFLKPFDADVLAIIVGRAFHVYDLEVDNLRLRSAHSSPLEGLITNDGAMLNICRMIEKVAPSNATVLLLGESGTGKEVLARAVHGLSPRADKRFVAINCAAIPENLLESELFGYEKGAFTGASKTTPGKIEVANQGTLFLDEIGDLPLPLQAKLLRFLQERVIERLGGRTEIPVDVRVVCATHQDLPNMISDGRFREDLYYRLTEITIAIPPLRERHGDAVLLAQAFLERHAKEQNRNLKGFTPEALKALDLHSWPGNVREMENLIKRAVIMSDGPMVNADDLGLKLKTRDEEPLNLRQVRDEAERQAVIRALARTGDNVAQASELLGISRPTLYDLMSKLGLK